MASAPIYYEILGDGMNEAFPAGSILECVGFKYLGRRAQHGDYVLASHTTPSGESKLDCFQHILTPDGPVLQTQPKEPGARCVIASEDIGAKAKYQIVACVMAYHCAEDDDEDAEEA